MFSKKSFIVFVLLIFVLAGCSKNVKTSYSAPKFNSSESVKEFHIKAFNFGFNPSEIKVKKGDAVRLIFTSSSGTHGVAIPDFFVHSAPIYEGADPVSVEFVADKTGIFPFFCNVPCGKGHENMRGRILVE